MTTTLEVELGTRRYPIWIGQGLLGDTAAWHGAIRGRHILIVSDTNVAPLYLDRLRAALDGVPDNSGAPAPGNTAGNARQIDALVLPAGEANKHLGSVAQVFDALARLGATRDACVIALGGGVIGDIAGFAAACWMRGIDFVQCPTTLLAMVDSSVGGKTGVDHPAGKNLIGAFHQPRAVIADPDTLASLPERELRAGLAEVVKTACIGDADFFAWLDAHVEALLALDTDAIGHAIATCCRFKAGVVARDEHESGERALLNFGHTFGHALEVETGYASLLHGEAIAIGMLAAARLSARLGMADAEDTGHLHSLLQRFGLPTAMPSGIDPDALLARMRLDKKNRAGAMRLILWRGIGHAEIVSGTDDGAILAVLREGHV